MTTENFMTVADLIKKLKEYDQDAVIALSSDSEGNNYLYMEKDGSIGDYLTEPDGWEAATVYCTDDDEDEDYNEENEGEPMDVKNTPNWKEKYPELLNTIILYPI